jgi:sirohydrochlorin cobaltochelatase
VTRAIVLFGHGSRDPQWREPMDAVAARIRARSPGVAVECAFLELQQPDLASCTSQLVGGGAGSITIVPMFLGAGRHAREDLPVLVAAAQARHPQVGITTTTAVGEWPGLLDLIADEAAKQA